MKFSHSRVDTYRQCPFKFKLRYIDKLDTLPNDDPANPLIIGNALHNGVQFDVEHAIKWYFDQYPIINDYHINEEIKLRHAIASVKRLLTGSKLEHEIYIDEGIFNGYIDLVEFNDDKTVNLYDIKYSNNIDNYLKSVQLHLYKYYYEKATKRTVKNIGYIFVPKLNIRQKKTETLEQFRVRLKENFKDPIVKLVEFDIKKVEQWIDSVIEIQQASEYPKNPSRLCDWCEYQEFCEKGDNLMILPKPERISIEKETFKKIWIYGAPFSGKTTFADQAEIPLNLNTDGNVKFVSMPRIPIKDEVTQEGRVRRKKFAWQVFKDAIDELEVGSDFKTIVVDLLEDTYEHCRLFMYDKLDIEHESDDSFRAWDKVRTEFLSTIKRLLNMDYNVILISHEDTSKDITARTGSKVTAIKPNINDKVANKIAGMVDIVARVVVEDGGEHKLSLKPNEVVFGGGRLANIETNEMELSWAEFSKLYGKPTAKPKKKPEPEPELEPEPTETKQELEPETKPVRRTRRVREA